MFRVEGFTLPTQL